MPDVNLYPGESTSVDVEFEATDTIPFGLEPVAKVYTQAEFAQDWYFSHITKLNVIAEDIQPT